MRVKAEIYLHELNTWFEVGDIDFKKNIAIIPSALVKNCSLPERFKSFSDLETALGGSMRSTSGVLVVLSGRAPDTLVMRTKC